jgi:hypothetical protein
LAPDSIGAVPDLARTVSARLPINAARGTTMAIRLHKQHARPGAVFHAAGAPPPLAMRLAAQRPWKDLGMTNACCNG